MATPVPAPTTIQITRLATETLLVPIVSTAPLIMHNWSAKAKQKMLDTQQKRASIKEPRNPEEEYESSFYRAKTGYGFPAIGFKSATVEAARFYDKSVTKVGLRQFLFFKGEFSDNDIQALFPIEGEPRMRQDMVTVGVSGTDLRYRAEFPEWSTVLVVTYVTSSLTQDSVLSLIGAAGLGVGIGDWRPEKGGDFGTFMLDPTRDMTVVAN